MRLYDHPASGNCLKARILLRQLGVVHETVTVDLFRGETRTPAHFARNPDGRVPVLELDDGATIPESGAILLYLADGTPLLPAGRLARARMHAWMFFEQNQIEPTIASARFLAAAGRDRSAPEAFADKVARGRAALATLERGLARRAPVRVRRRLHGGRHRAVRLRALRRRRRRRRRPARARTSARGSTASRGPRPS